MVKKEGKKKTVAFGYCIHPDILILIIAILLSYQIQICLGVL